MRKVPSLKQLAAEAVARDTSLTELPHNIAVLIKYYRGEIRVCEHGTTWTYKRNKVNGIVIFICGCTEVWKDNEYNEGVKCDRVLWKACWCRACGGYVSSQYYAS